MSLYSPATSPGTTPYVTFLISNLIPQIGSKVIAYADGHCGRELIEGTNPDGSTSTTLSLELLAPATAEVSAKAVDVNGNESACSNAASYTYDPVISPSPSPNPTVSPSPSPSSSPSPLPSSSPMPVPTTTMAVTYQINPGHSGYISWSSSLVNPSAPAWTSTLGGSASYPLIANGVVYALAAGLSTGGSGTRLYALDLATGSTVWGPIDVAGTYDRAGLAYDGGKIFVINSDGVLRSYDATTGAAGWSATMPTQYMFTAPPTAVNGRVYLGGAGSGGTLYSVDESNGQVLWSASVANGDQSSPAISDDGVFVSYPCQIYKFAPSDGTLIWHDSNGCDGGGGKTPAYANGSLYVRDLTNPIGSILSALDGSSSGSFGNSSMSPIPAIGPSRGYYLYGGTLHDGDLLSQNSVWSFAGDGSLVTAPIIINNTVIVASSSGTVYSLDASTGSTLWSGAAGAAIAAPDEQNVSAPLVGLSAGEGYLVVPAGSKITAWRLIP